MNSGISGSMDCEIQSMFVTQVSRENNCEFKHHIRYEYNYNTGGTDTVSTMLVILRRTLIPSKYFNNQYLS